VILRHRQCGLSNLSTPHNYLEGFASIPLEGGRGNEELFNQCQVSVSQDDKSLGDGLHNVNMVNTTDPYI
jgi:hypothetical protein